MSSVTSRARCQFLGDRAGRRLGRRCLRQHCLARSPNPGAFTAATLTRHAALSTTSVASASPSTSSATISRGPPELGTTASRMGSMAYRLESFLLHREGCRALRARPPSCQHRDINRRHSRDRTACLSTTSSSVSRLFASSMVITPSLPTFCMALAIISPMSLSPLAGNGADLRDLFRALDLLGGASRCPRCRMHRLIDAALDVHGVHAGGDRLGALATMAVARTQAGIVPSPATLDWSCRRLRGPSAPPCSSNLSLELHLLATVTPSLVVRGARKLVDHHIAALRPASPSRHSPMSTPRSIRSRASAEKRTSLAGHRPALHHRLIELLGGGPLAAFHDAHDVDSFMIRDLAIELDFGARPLPNSTKSPGSPSIGMTCPLSSRPPDRRRSPRLHGAFPERYPE